MKTPEQITEEIAKKILTAEDWKVAILASIKEAIQQCEPWMEHKIDCGYTSYVTDNCTCGLDELKKSFQK